MNTCYMAVHKQTGHYFSGRKGHIGFSKINFLRTSMTYAKASKDDYIIISLSFDENMTPTLTEIIK